MEPTETSVEVAEEICTDKQQNNDEQPPKEDKYYQDAKKYWSKISPTVDGMLGGFGSISFTDTRGSDLFLKNLFKMKPAPGRSVALDCGAGIGRVSKNLLMNWFEKVDLVEQDEQFCRTAEKELAASGKLGSVFNTGLQNYTPQEGKYDVIWSQWVLGHLTDEDIVAFFFRCTRGLTKNGIMVMKENFTNGDDVEMDKKDSSVTRPLSVMKQLLTKGNLRVVKEQRQKDFPKDSRSRFSPFAVIILRSDGERKEL
ncbi:N-terminal Xaa-Pro-Lys N-methyltransferase 1-A isoform X2 [Toxorhynchites rutilus septentrionalis]|uniref:N-terminal Xaa-Pro-Lys N-methyltransferase 1-A isoform X2 n=1 Tax=Toxorhynchites rutilus septentrionalis TaxID=329112 RepID=UPI002479CFC2|nr:N-terminal Xaa-Pro-Lys N-methyltransferase 1-A isoform X2 [Toxorhynchites rutilus septentrionalis]